MQYLKEDVKDRILSSALKEFMEKGFLDASMREIASHAGVAQGNVYRYFKNKEDLFNSIIGPVHSHLMTLIVEIGDVYETNIDSMYYINSIRDRIMEVFEKFSSELLILMDKSKGTEYQNTREEVILIVEQILNKTLIPELIKDGIEIRDEFITYVLSSTLIDGVCVILRKKENGTKTKLLIDQFIHILFLDITKRFF